MADEAEMADGEVESYDVLVVGGGAAGLSAALTLGRARRSVLVVDAGEPRNAPADAVHNYLGREGTPPGELLAIGRAEVASYGGEVVSGTVTDAQPLDGPDGGFLVRLTGERPGGGTGDRSEDGTGGQPGSRTVRARRLLVTTGLADELPDVPGLAQRWGHDVLHCPYCHGWEVRDQPIGILGGGPFAIHQALLWRQWSDDVCLFTHTGPAPGPDEGEQLAARGITVVPGEVTGVEVTGDQLTGIRLGSGEVISRRALAVTTRVAARAGLLASLGLEPADRQLAGHSIGSYLPADPVGATAVPGVWVAGNVTDVMAQVISSAAAGVMTAAAINADLIAADTQAAVAAHRAEQAQAQAQVSTPSSGPGTRARSSAAAST
jgi:thioredoxin reductase